MLYKHSYINSWNQFEGDSMRLRKSIKILPGVKINLSKTGVSGTLGCEGLSLSIGKNDIYVNTGISGTGLYDRIKITVPEKKETE
jgi:hypothetical protein